MPAGDQPIVRRRLLHPPADALAWPRQNLVLAVLHLVPELAGVRLPIVDIIFVAPWLDSRHRVLTQVRLEFGGKDHRLHAAG